MPHWKAVGGFSTGGIVQNRDAVEAQIAIESSFQKDWGFEIDKTPLVALSDVRDISDNFPEENDLWASGLIVIDVEFDGSFTPLGAMDRAHDLVQTSLVTFLHDDGWGGKELLILTSLTKDGVEQEIDKMYQVKLLNLVENLNGDGLRELDEL